MKKKNIIIIISVIVLAVLSIFTLLILMSKNKKSVDENVLYEEKIGNVTYRFTKYDDVLGGRMTTGLERSLDDGKTYERVTEEPITISREGYSFKVQDENVIYVNSNGYIDRKNDFIGFKVSLDGGKTFQNATFNYPNTDIDIIDIERFPTVENNKLELNCSIYALNKAGTNYNNYDIYFISEDQGLTWNYQE